MEQVNDDILHDHFLNASDIEVDGLVLPVGLFLFWEGSDNFVQPKLDSQIDSVECLLAQDLHHKIFILSSLLHPLCGFYCSLGCWPGCYGNLLLQLPLPYVFGCLLNGFFEPPIYYEIWTEQFRVESILLFVRTQLENSRSFEGLFINLRDFINTLAAGWFWDLIVLCSFWFF